MRNIQSIFLLAISFFLAFELISFCGKDDIILDVNEIGHNYFDERNMENVYFIGDSYASTNYAKEGFPMLFSQYFAKRKWNFFDLSKAGTELSDHKILLDSVSESNPKLIIYYYNISDIVSIQGGQLKDAANHSKKNKSQQKWTSQILDWFNNKSATVIFIKKAAHHISLLLTDKFLPGTPASEFPRKTEKYKKELEKIFQDIKCQNLIILVNTPYSAGDRPKKWKHYKVFQEIAKNNAFTLIQGIDLIPDSKYAISWQNGHPNQEGIYIIKDTLTKIFDTIQ